MKIALGHFLKLIRWPNLLMTAIAISVHWYFLLYLPIIAYGLIPGMDIFGILLLGLNFAMVMGAGYVINDIRDVAIDKINRGSTQIIDNHIPIQQGKQIYILLNLGAVVMTGLIAYKYQAYNNFYWLAIAISILYIYSAFLKRKAFIGNLVIAILCGAVLLLPYAMEYHIIARMNVQLKGQITIQFFGCGLIALLLSLCREITKDQQDILGDQAFGARTLPIIWGPKHTNYFIAGFNLVTLSTLYFLIKHVQPDTAGLMVVAIIMAVPLSYISYLLIYSAMPVGYQKASSIYKFVMAIGMVLLPIVLSQIKH